MAVIFIFNYKIPCQRDNWKINYWISPFFYLKSPMSMEMTWLEFQLSTDNQNGRHLATNFVSNFFFRIPSKPGIYIYRFSGSVSLLVLSVFMWDWKQGCDGHFDWSILINRTYFQLIALKPGIYRVTASAEGYLSACTVCFRFGIIINVLVSSVCFIWIPMLWGYGHYK